MDWLVAHGLVEQRAVKLQRAQVNSSQKNCDDGKETRIYPRAQTAA